jgi:hypothetical protein
LREYRFNCQTGMTIADTARSGEDTLKRLGLLRDDTIHADILELDD